MVNTHIPTAIVFDIGNVLIGWDPRHLYKKIFADSDELDWFLDHVVTLEWHTHHDRGRSFAEGCAERAKKFPQYSDQIYLYKSRWRETILGPIEGSVALLKQLKKSAVPLYALSNFSAETFPDCVAEFEFLKLFDDILISGDVGFVKPEPEIYQMAMKQFGLAPFQAIFIDDRAENVEAGERVGLIPHQFITPEKLRAFLQGYSFIL